MRTKGILSTLLFVYFTSVLATSQVYTITDLGPLTPTAINSWVQVVGNYNNQAYIWSFGRMKPLGLLPGGTFSSAADINDLEMVAGTADGAGIIAAGLGLPNYACSSGLIQPFVWTKSTGMEGLGTIFAKGVDELIVNGISPCTGQFYSTGINNQGQLVGNTTQLP